jgi:hypothetical protein
VTIWTAAANPSEFWKRTARAYTSTPGRRIRTESHCGQGLKNWPTGPDFQNAVEMNGNLVKVSSAWMIRFLRVELIQI